MAKVNVNVFIWFSLFLQKNITFLYKNIITCRIIESKNSQYPVGKHVLGDFGWRTYTISNGKDKDATLLPEMGNLPLSLGIGVLGMPG